MSENEEQKTCACEPGCSCDCDCENNKCSEDCNCDSKQDSNSSSLEATKDEDKNYITFDEFKKAEMTIGKIASVEVVEDADKLLKLSVDFGDMGTRQIVSGIREYFEDPQSIVGKRVPFATNLQPRTIRGLESNGMIIAVSDKNGNGFSLLEVGEQITPGSSLS
jgi:methionyl-tRNA synthetase